MFGKIMDLKKLFEQAQQFQSQITRELEGTEVEGESGGGMVRARMNGKKELLSLQIDRESFRESDLDLLPDLVVAAVNQCSRKVDEILQSKMGNLTSQFQLPNLFGR